LEVARHSSLGGLKVQTRKRRHRAADADALYRAQREARAVHHWRDELGMVRCTVALPPDVGVPFVHRLDAETDRIRRGARREGGSEARAAYAADALVRLVSAKTIGRATTADLVIVCDVRAYRRGHAHDGELCHLLDGGPIPVSVARKLAEGAFIKAVLHDGVRIDTVAHFGRHILPACGLPSRSAHHPSSTASCVVKRAVVGATGWKSITSTREPTTA